MQELPQCLWEIFHNIQFSWRTLLYKTEINDFKSVGLPVYGVILCHCNYSSELNNLVIVESSHVLLSHLTRCAPVVPCVLFVVKLKDCTYLCKWKISPPKAHENLFENSRIISKMPCCRIDPHVKVCTIVVESCWKHVMADICGTKISIIYLT